MLKLIFLMKNPLNMKSVFTLAIILSASFYSLAQKDSVSVNKFFFPAEELSIINTEWQKEDFKLRCDELLRAPSLNKHLGLEFDYGKTFFDLKSMTFTGNFYNTNPFSLYESWKIDGAALYRISEKSVVGIVGWHEHTLRTPFAADKNHTMQGVSLFVGHKFTKKFKIEASFSFGKGNMEHWSNPQQSVRW